MYIIVPARAHRYDRVSRKAHQQNIKRKKKKVIQTHTFMK